MTDYMSPWDYDAWIERAGKHIAMKHLLRKINVICGYNPQMLLPAPSFEREFMQTIAEWAAEQLKKPYAFAAANYMADHAEDILRYQDQVRRVQEDIPLVIGTDFIAVESKVLNYMYATFIHESDIGDRVPRGKIELFDYDDDHTVINLEGSGELPGRRDLVDDLFSGQFARQLGKTASMTAMMRKLERRPAPQKSYLDHDPTKRHKRSKRR